MKREKLFLTDLVAEHHISSVKVNAKDVSEAILEMLAGDKDIESTASMLRSIGDALDGIVLADRRWGRNEDD